MSISVAMKTPNKTEVANVLSAVAKLIEASGNQTVGVNMTVTFNKCKKAGV